jgi:hypothetical protein
LAVKYVGRKLRATRGIDSSLHAPGFDNRADIGEVEKIQPLPPLWGIGTNADREAMPSLPSQLARPGI